jgi:hypothetical protein
MATLPNGKAIAPTAHGGKLFHGTCHISPDVAFAQGLPARGVSIDLLGHSTQSVDSAFRGATTMRGTPNGSAGALAWAEAAIGYTKSTAQQAGTSTLLWKVAFQRQTEGLVTI